MKKAFAFALSVGVPIITSKTIIDFCDALQQSMLDAVREGRVCKLETENIWK